MTMKPLSKFHVELLNLFNKLNSLVLVSALLLVVSLDVVESGSSVKTLPGFLGDLPFTLETGYIGVGESEDVQLFYYFFESERNPKSDPLMIWLTGGPGASVLSAIMYQIGPFTINNANSTLEKQMLEIKPYSWTKEANIIFIDQPAGSGFSYANTPEAYITNDTFATMHAYQFVKKWLMDHPKFLNNPFYVAGDSYAGILVPMIVQEIYNGNQVGEGPYINIKGYVLGNPGADTHQEFNLRIQYGHRMALLSDAIYKSTKDHCHGEYLNVDPNNTLCINDLQVVEKCLGRINLAHILEPSCEFSNSKKHDLFRRGIRSIENAFAHISSSPQVQYCREYNYIYTAPWANNREVREALHIREEFNDIEWVSHNETLMFDIGKKPISYTHNIWNVVAYHRHLTHIKCRALVYSGDHDLGVSYLSTLNWIGSLNLLLEDDWRPYLVDDQVAGYTMKYYSKHLYNLTFMTIKGGGHTAAEYKHKECFNMFTRWLDIKAL